MSARSDLQQKWRRVIRPSCLVLAAIAMFVLFFCNVAINRPLITEPVTWNSATYFQNCTDLDDEIYGPLRNRPARSDVSAEASKKVYSGPKGAEALPRGIVESTTNLELGHLWKYPDKDSKPRQNLLAMAVGVKQKKNVDKIVQKFPADNFTVMLFHYDGKVDGWLDMAWTSRAIHVMAFNQTKWWFAKRFLHPDVVQQYNYMFLWDEDLGVEHFHADRYLAIMEDEGFEISQPALHRNSSEVHHRLTILNRKTRAHRRIYSYAQRQQCDAQSNGPPCTGWVEMMAPVFSRAAWRCTWNMIQNDLVHAWGLDYKLGYCAQGRRADKVGIIDEEFIVHEGIPSLGGPSLKTAQAPLATEGKDRSGKGLLPGAKKLDERFEIRRRAGVELTVFSRRWRRAAANDPDWEDPYYKPPLETNITVTPQGPAVAKADTTPVALDGGENQQSKMSKESRKGR